MHDQGRDSGLIEDVSPEALEAGLAQSVAELGWRFPGAVAQQPIADDPFVQNPEPSSLGVLLEPPRQKVGQAVIRVRRRAVPIDPGISESDVHRGAAGRLDLNAGQERLGADLPGRREGRPSGGVSGLRRDEAVLLREQMARGLSGLLRMKVEA